MRRDDHISAIDLLEICHNHDNGKPLTLNVAGIITTVRSLALEGWTCRIYQKYRDSRVRVVFRCKDGFISFKVGKHLTSTAAWAIITNISTYHDKIVGECVLPVTLEPKLVTKQVFVGLDKFSNTELFDELKKRMYVPIRTITPKQDAEILDFVKKVINS